MAVLWLSLAMLKYSSPGFVSRSRGSVMAGHLSLIAITLFAALHQGFCLWITRRRLDSNRPLPRTLFNYVNSFIEINCVSIAMLILLDAVEPALAMLGVPLLGYFLLLITSSLKLDSVLCVFVGVVAAAQYGLLAWLHWDEIIVYHPPDSPIPTLGYPMRVGMLLVSGIAAGLVSWLLRRTVIDTVATATAHAQIVRLFGEHVSPGVAAELLARFDGDWSEVRASAVLVADLRGFTRYAEMRAPSECVGTLNALWAEMVHCVERRGGIINKFLGMVSSQCSGCRLRWSSRPRPRLHRRVSCSRSSRSSRDQFVRRVLSRLSSEASALGLICFLIRAFNGSSAKTIWVHHAEKRDHRACAT